MVKPVGLKDCIREMGPLGRWLSTVDDTEPAFFTSREAGDMRSRIRLALAGGVELEIRRTWGTIDGLLRQAEPGLAFREAKASLASVPELVSLEEVAYPLDIDTMLRLLDPFVVASAEVKCAFAPQAETFFEASYSAAKLAAAEYVNAIRRALVDLGLRLWASPVTDLIDSLRDDVEDFLEAQNFLALETSEPDEEDRCSELLDRVARIESSLGHGLMRLFRFNAQCPEVHWRFAHLWSEVAMRRDNHETAEAMMAARTVLDEAFSLAGLDFDELVDRIDLVADLFSEPDALRTAVLVAESMPEGEPSGNMENEFLAVMEQALVEMGLDLAAFPAA